MTSLETVLHCGVVSLLWGVTNILIKKSTAGIAKVEAKNSLQKFINEIKYLAVNWKYVLFFLINQIGSVLYFILLQNADLSLIVPMVNSLTFIVTGFIDSLFGGNTPSSRAFVGVVLILSGITFCVVDQVQKTNSTT